MASSPTDLPIRRFKGADGLDLAYRETGKGFPVVLIHGLFSNGFVNWIKYGHATRIAAAGFRVIMPDLRGHGASAAPHEATAYPPDILAADGEALIEQLGLSDYHLGGYSLGARTSVRLLARGAAPRRAVIAGMGLQGLLDTHGRSGFFRRVLMERGGHAPGSPEWLAEGFLRSTGGDPAAMIPLLDSFVDSTRDDLARITLPILVLTGIDDQDNGSAADLARALPDARLQEIPGNHMSAVLKPELGGSIANFFMNVDG